MSTSNPLQSDSFLERAAASGLMTEANIDAFVAVDEMSKRPLSLEQKREQVRKGNPDAVRYGDPTKRLLQSLADC